MKKNIYIYIYIYINLKQKRKTKDEEIIEILEDLQKDLNPRKLKKKKQQLNQYG